MRKRRPEERYEIREETAEGIGQRETGQTEPAETKEPDATVTIPVTEFEQLAEQAAEWRDRCLRVAADYENFRKRTEREREEIMCFANERLISELLPILDNLDRALGALPQDGSPGSIAEGVRLISRQLHAVLERCGLEPLQTMGAPFDPNLHEAVAVLPSEGHEEGTVVAEVQKGYRLKGKVLRHSMVQVAGPGATDDESVSK